MLHDNSSQARTPQQQFNEAEEQTQKHNASKKCRESSSSNSSVGTSVHGMRLASVVILICLLANGISKTNAVPTDSRESSISSINTGDNNNNSVGDGIRFQRALRDELVNAAPLMAIASAEQQPPAAAPAALLGKESSSTSSSSTELQTEQQQQPQGQCLLEGLWVPEHTVHCEKKPGCRAIQKTGHCCPDYKCDCEKDGKTYMNNDKLVDLGTPCTVCYCKGGEILCSPVTCFHRDDCKPKYVPGRCCPEYDNCPILDKKPPSIAKITKPKQEMPPPPTFNWNITIKEITKPTEIRITDDNKPKTKPLIPTRKSTTESPSTTSSTTEQSTTSTAAAAATITTTATTKTQPSTEAPTSANEDAAADAARIVESSLSADNGDDEFNNAKAAEKAVVPAVTATATALPTHNGERLKLVASIAYNTVSEKPLASSQQTAPSERVPELSIRDAVPADKFKPIRMSAEVSAANERSNVMELSIHDAIPVDRFDPLGVEVVSSANDPSKVNIKREYLITTEGTAAGQEAQSERPDYNERPGYNDALVERIVADNEPEAAGSDNIYRIIATTDGPMGGMTEAPRAVKTTTVSSSTTTTTPTPTTQAADVQATSTNAPPTSTIDSDYSASTLSTDENNSTSNSGSTTDMSLCSSTTESTQHLEDDDGPPVETNPAYPSLPEDDFSLRDVNFPLVEADDIGEVELKDEQRSIVGSYDMQMHNKHVVEDPGLLAMESGSGSGSGSGGIMPAESYIMAMYASSTEGSNNNKLNVPLMYSSEEASGETSIQNASDFQLSKSNAHNTENDTTTSQEVSLESESLEAIMSAGSGSGSGELLPSGVAATKQREYTTPRPIRRAVQALDIDELTQSGDGQLTPLAEDPKLEVESLKLDESQERNDKAIVGSNAADKVNVRAEQSVEAAAAVVGGSDGDGDAIGQRIQRLYLHRVY